LFAGVDFPKLLVQCFEGKSPSHQTARIGVRSRLLWPKEIEYLNSVLTDPNVSSYRKAACTIEFMRLGVSPSVHSDLWFAGDRLLYFTAIPPAIKRFLQ